jgi:hypothetical protein
MTHKTAAKHSTTPYGVTAVFSSRFKTQPVAPQYGGITTAAALRSIKRPHIRSYVGVPFIINTYLPA